MLALVRVASEVNLKSGRVKARFLRRLIKNMKDALQSAGGSYKLNEKWSRVFAEVESPAALAALTRVFGVGSVSPIEYQCEPTVAAMRETALRYGPRLTGKTFRMRVKRAGVEGFTSHDIEIELGAVLAPYARGVDLKRAEITVEVEVRPEGAFFYTERLPGPGGLPLGVEGKALCLISGGFDSSVAAWHLMKRGVELDFFFCNLAGQHYERSVVCVTKALCALWAHGTRPKLYVAEFAEISKAIRTEVRPSFAQVVLKRAMMKVANRVADTLEDIPALITGEAMGQVSSQTLHNLAAIEDASERPILRPLIGADKDEILFKARAIGTFSLSEHVDEYCAITLKKTVTRCSTARAQEEEAKIPETLYEQAASTAKAITLANLADEDLVTQYLFTDYVPDTARVIDCRPPHHFKAWHYPLAEQWDMDDLLAGFNRLDKAQTYILYCPTGLQTAVAAEKMQNAGYVAYSFKGGTKALMQYAGRLPKTGPLVCASREDVTSK